MSINFGKVGVGLVIVAATAGVFGLAPGALAMSLEENLTLNGDVEKCYTIPEGKTVTVDLNGYTITCAGDNAFIVEDGATLTIKDDNEDKGAVKAMTKGKAAVYNKVGGTVTIDGGNYYADNWYTVKNLGTMTIEDGTFSQNEKMYSNTDGYSNASLIANGWYNAKKLNGASDQGNAHTGDIVAELTINGGWFKHFSTTSTIKSDDYSVTNVNGGLFESAKGYLVQATGDVTIDGGIFKGYDSLLVYNATGDAKYEPGKAVVNGGDVSAKYIADARKSHAELTVNGGKFEGLEAIYANTELSGALKGGAYNIEPETGYLAEGYTVYASADGENYRVMKTVVTPEVVDDVTGKDSEGAESNEKVMGDVAQKVATALAMNYDAEDEQIIELGDGVAVQVMDAGALRRALDNGKDITMVLASGAHEPGEEELEAIAPLMKDGTAVFGTFDYDVFLIAGDGPDVELIARVTEFPAELELKFDISSASKVEAGKMRIWKAIRIHDGEAEALSVVDNGDGTLTAKSNKFSTYILTYEDVEEGAGAAGEVEATTPETGASTAATSAASNLAATMVLATIVGIVTMIAFEKKFIFKK